MSYLARMMYMQNMDRYSVQRGTVQRASLHGGLNGGAEDGLSRRKRSIEGSYGPPG